MKRKKVIDYTKIYKQIKRLKNNTRLCDCFNFEYVKTKEGIKCHNGVVYEWERFKRMPLLVLSLKPLKK